MRSVFVRHRWEPYLWILPSILLMLVFVVFPIGIVFRLAFSRIGKPDKIPSLFNVPT